MSSAELSLRQLCEDALREAGDISALQGDAIRADFQLRFEHPGKYVAYIDRYQVRNKTCRLAREVLACSSDLSEVNAAFVHFGSKKRAKVQVEYLEPLVGDFEAHHDLPYR
jgi:hypothetical protein